MSFWQKRKRLTTSYKLQKAIVWIFMIAFLYISFFQNKQAISDGIIPVLISWGIGILLLFFYRTRNIVEYDGNCFYILDWKGNQRDVVPIEKVTSMLFSGFSLAAIGSSYRFFYDNGEGRKKEFWVFPNTKTNTWMLKEDLKKKNPKIVTTNLSFGGIEHLIFRDEKWFR